MKMIRFYNRTGRRSAVSYGPVTALVLVILIGTALAYLAVGLVAALVLIAGAVAGQAVVRAIRNRHHNEQE